MQDKEHINAAFGTTIQALYQKMLGAYAVAGGNKQAEEKANESFSAAIMLARRVRDEAAKLCK